MSETDTPEAYRRRYFDLKARARESNARRPSASRSAKPHVISREEIITAEDIPAGWYWTTAVKRGATLRIINPSATSGVSVLIWNADDTSERFNPADSIKVQWTARIGAGKLLLSDMGRVLASITDDGCGMHDCIAGGSTPESNARKFGAGASVRNTRDNFLLAAGKLGLGPRDVGPCITFFAPVTTDSTGRFVWRDDAIKPGDHVDLRAEMNLLVALSNCPHPLDPASRPREHAVGAVVWRSLTAQEDDPFRYATEEAVRAFENTDAMFTNGRSGS
jgi:urea carboxylase-associated protein 2